MNRQYVYLSVDTDIANLAGKRRDYNPVILIIDAITAFSNVINSILGMIKYGYVIKCQQNISKYLANIIDINFKYSKRLPTLENGSLFHFKMKNVCLEIK